MSEPSNLLVVAMGLGTVFTGLICIIIMSSLMSAIVKAIEGNKPAPVPAAPVGTSAGVIENKQEIIAAVSAVIAEELGTEASNIRIHSFKKVN